MNSLTDLQTQCRPYCQSLPCQQRSRIRSQNAQRTHCSHRQLAQIRDAACGCARVTTALLAQQLVCAQLAGATEAVGGVADATSSTLPLALGGGAAIAALSAALITTDPQKRCCSSPHSAADSIFLRTLSRRASCRRTAQTATAGGNEKDAVKSYFNTNGFERWNRIYGTTDDVNKVCWQ